MRELPAGGGARVFVDEIDGHVTIVRPCITRLIPTGGRCHGCGRELQAWSFREIDPNRVAIECTHCFTVFAHVELATEIECSGEHEAERRPPSDSVN